MRISSNGLSNRGSITRPLINKTFFESGSDFLGFVTVQPSPTVVQRILKSNSISPSAFPGTRISQLSNLWERYRFHKFRLRWVPAVPKTIACQFVIYQDTDPLDDPTVITDADALIRQATAQTGSQQFNFINAKTIDLASRADGKMYYTGLDKQNERFNRQGNFYVIQVTNPLNFNGEPLPSPIEAGSLYVDWTCEFQTAQINPSAVVAALSEVKPATTELLTLPAIRFDQTSYPVQLLGTITTIGLASQVTVTRFETGSDLNDSYRSELSISLIEVGVMDLNDNASGNEGKFTSSNAILPAGTYDVTLNTTGSGAGQFYILQEGVTLRFDSLGGVSPSFTPA